MDGVFLVAVWLFAVTHVDTLLVIGAFCADNQYRRWEVLCGHYLGFTIGLAVAVGGALIAAQLLAEWTFVLGLVPIAIGSWGLLRRPPEESIDAVPAVPNAVGRIGVVTAAGIGLSGENVAVFVPFFADLSQRLLALIVASYLVGAGVIFLLALGTVSRLASEGISDRLDRWLVPTVLLVVGSWVLLSGLVIS